MLVKAIDKALQAQDVETKYLDLRVYPLPLCDGDTAYEHPSVEVLAQMIRQADAVLIGIPVYNFDINAAVKNLVELTGSAWENQVVGFLCAAGGRSSYMSVMNFANDLMLDFRCLILPRFIYAVGGDFSESTISNPEIEERIQRLALETKQLAGYRQSIR
jgi:FMN reductase